MSTMLKTAWFLLALAVTGASLLVTLPARAADPAPAPLDWISAANREHPLVGKLYAADRRRFVPLDLLAREIVFEDFVLLGEVHDNPDHHRIRAWAIAAMAKTSAASAGRIKPAALVFEHIKTDKADALAAPGAGSADDLMTRIDWDNSGWPARALFLPLFEAALAGKLALHAGDAPRPAMMSVARQGEAGLAAGERDRLRLDPPLPAPLADGLLAELEASHCNLIPRDRFGNMAVAQRFRDAYIADRMVAAAADGSPVILLAGNGHVRADRGVPWYLRLRAPGRKIIAIEFLEVAAGRTDPEAYIERAADGRPAADYVVFTPAASRPDPCEEMRRQFKR